MIDLTLASPTLSTARVDAVVIGVAPGPAGGPPVLAPGAGDLDKAFGKRLATTLGSLGATGKVGQVTTLATLGATTAGLLVAVGVGGAVDDRYDTESVRRAAGGALRTLPAGVTSVAVGLSQVNGEDDLETLGAAAEGVLFGSYRFTRYHGAGHAADPQPAGPVTATLVVGSPRSKPAKTALARAVTMATSVFRVRDLVNTPAADLHPADLAAAAKRECEAVGATIEILDEKALTKGGYGGILGVGQGSSHPPRLVRIAWSGGRKPAATVHLVGKGITFDSGGLSLKPNDGMVTMKCDMSGAAAVIGTMRAVAELNLPVAVVGWVATAENMPSGTAIRPSDVLTMRGGRTVEVNNTDAEGRLVMADAIVRAGEESPDVIIDIATLTGAQVVALGTRVFAVMGNDDALRDDLVAAAGRSGEQAWPMPLPAALRSNLDSPIADIRNTGDRAGGMLSAGLFLQDFVADGVRWAHVDIAGPAFNDGAAYDYTPTGGTGTGVRTLVGWLQTLTR